MTCSSQTFVSGTSDGSVLRQVSWTLGARPQDVRFPTNISQVAFTVNYFAALTSDRIKIFVNRRAPGQLANCKRKSIEFDSENRPERILGFGCRDVLCVAFLYKVEFYSLVTLDKVGVYQTAARFNDNAKRKTTTKKEEEDEAEKEKEATEEEEEFLSCVSSRSDGGSPLGVLWCRREDSRRRRRRRRRPARHVAFTSWTGVGGHVVVPTCRLQVDGVGRRGDAFQEFGWTSETTALLMTSESSGRTLLCSFDVERQRQLGRLEGGKRCRVRLAPAGQHLLLVRSNRYELYDSASLRLRRRLPRIPSSSPLDHAVNDNGDVVRWNGESNSLEFFANFRLLRRLEPTARLKVGDVEAEGVTSCRVRTVGGFGVLCVAQFEEEIGQLRRQNSGWTDLLLSDFMGRVLLRCRWPRSVVHHVSESRLVQVQRLCTKPFSAAHVKIFDFAEAQLTTPIWTGTAASTARGDDAVEEAQKRERERAVQHTVHGLPMH